LAPASHPTYPKPTIIQVTCEIAFTSDLEIKMSAGALYPIFAKEFPEIHPVGNAAFQLLIGQPVVLPEPAQSQSAVAFRFATPDGKRFVQLSKANFVYQTNEPYLGWKDFRTTLVRHWSAYAKAASPTTIAKIGLRYINRIVKSKAKTNLSDWFKATPDLPPALIASRQHFLGRIESSPSESHLKLVTLSSEPPGPDWPQGTIIMDIDRINLDPHGATKVKILENLELLHEDIWSSFDSAATETLKNYLSGK
jgi:uncharacterized protein (TIGR04255 family)